MPSTRHSRTRARSQPRYGPPPLDHSPPRRSSSTARLPSPGRAFKVLKMMLETLRCGRDMPSGAARIGPKGNELLQRILTTLREKNWSFFSWERYQKFTYEPRTRTLTYMPPSLIIQNLVGGLCYKLTVKVGLTAHEFPKNRDGGDCSNVAENMLVMTKPRPVQLRGTDKEAYLDSVCLFRCPVQPGVLESVECFGIEAGFRCQHRGMKKKVSDLMVANGGILGMVIVFRVGYDSEATYEDVAADPDAVAALNKEADFTIIQVLEKVDGSGLKVRHPVKNRIFRDVDGLPIDGHLEFTVGDMVGVVVRRELPDNPYAEQILQRRITIPFSDMVHWIEEGEDWIRRRKLSLPPFGSSVPKRKRTPTLE